MAHLIDQIMAYEAGELNEADTVSLFQRLLDDGTVWQLQGHYGRTAKAMLDAGLIHFQSDKPLRNVVNRAIANGSKPITEKKD